MRELSIDIETYSDADLGKTGVHKYAEDASFRILLFAYAFDDEKVQCFDVAHSDTGIYGLPAEIQAALTDDKVIKRAFNASFEFACLSKFFPLDIRQWRCTMVLAASCGLPMSLDKCAEVLCLTQQKMKEGKALIREFSTLKGKTKVFNREHWAVFMKYCAQDVETERAIKRALPIEALPQREEALYQIDHNINTYGVLIDERLVRSAIDIDEGYKATCESEACDIAGVNDKPTSVANIKAFCARRAFDMDKVDKKTVAEVLTQQTLPEDVRRLLELRQELSKTSTAKYSAMQDRMCQDNRARGILQFYATRTGRWAGRGVQVQNLPQNHLACINLARNLIIDKRLGMLASLYKESVSQVLSELIRTAFIAPEGKVFAVADFSAIEARVIAWLAKEEWRLDVFRNGGDIYCASASKIYGVPVEKHGRNAHLRQKGKIAELALGYQGAVGAMKAFGADKAGLDDKAINKIVKDWRKSSPNIVKLWADIEEAWVSACMQQGHYFPVGCIAFRVMGDYMEVRLPAGRELRYYKPGYQPRIHYYGMVQTTNHWEKIETYGGKLTENAVQAIARDCLAEVMLRQSRETDNPIVMHVHDEIIVEVDEDKAQQELDTILEIMSREITWAKGLPLKGAGYTTKYYIKD